MHRVVTAGMEILIDGKWVCMKRTADNYFIVNGLGEIKFPMKVRVTSISGEQLESTLPDIKNDENIPSEIQYSGFKPGMPTFFGNTDFCSRLRMRSSRGAGV